MESVARIDVRPVVGCLTPEKTRSSVPTHDSRGSAIVTSH